MSRIATGAITITDIADGGSPISAFLTNENHTFAASSVGDVASSERDAFTTSVSIFMGFAAGTYKNSAVALGSTDYNKFSYGTLTSSSAGWTTAVDASTGDVTISAIPTGTSNKSTVITIPISVNDTSQSLKSTTLSLTLTKAIEGTGGAVVQLTATKQYFQYDEFATLAPAVQSDIVMTIETQGNIGTLTAQKSIDGASFTTLASGSTADLADTLDIDGVGTDQIIISSANFSDSNTMTIRVNGANGGSDSVSLVRVRDGVRGASALVVDIVSNDGSIFKNNTGSDKTITCNIYDMINGAAVTHVGTSSGETSVNYNWQRVDAGGTSSDVLVSSGTRNVVSSGGVTSDGLGASTLVIGATDISDNSSTQFSCEVTVTVH